MAYDNTNSGVLFTNNEKKSDKQPDLKGTINIDGVDYELAAWKRESKAGKPFLSLKVSEPYKGKKQVKEPIQEIDIASDEIPF